MPPNNYDPYSEEQYEKSDHQNMNDVADDEMEKNISRRPSTKRSQSRGKDEEKRRRRKRTSNKGEKYSSKKQERSTSSRKSSRKKEGQKSTQRSSSEKRTSTKHRRRIKRENEDELQNNPNTSSSTRKKQKRKESKRKESTRKEPKGRDSNRTEHSKKRRRSSPRKTNRRIPEPPLLINLKEEREGLELTREQLSRQARIPVEYIVALETGVYKNLRKGKTSEKYKKRYLYFLDLPLHAELVTPLPSVSPRKMGFIHTITTSSFEHAPRRAVTKLIMAAMIIVIFIVSVLKFVSVISEKSEESNPIVQVPSSIATASKTFFDGVKLRAIGHSKATIYADGELIHKGKLEPMKHMKFPYRNKLVIEIEKIGAVDVYSNGRRVRPQGNLQGSRTLTFVRSESNL